ncbi:MAG: hypothetical protein F6K36_18535 [Symploca sp. SIO3C6]|nr:hypothetical protein [Symploca sp. SIO3C6]NET07758.1 hypothetical protein [Symploca sp. SIO2B6]
MWRSNKAMEAIANAKNQNFAKGAILIPSVPISRCPAIQVRFWQSLVILSLVIISQIDTSEHCIS